MSIFIPATPCERIAKKMSSAPPLRRCCRRISEKASDTAKTPWIWRLAVLPPCQPFQNRRIGPVEIPEGENYLWHTERSESCHCSVGGHAIGAFFSNWQKIAHLGQFRPSRAPQRDRSTGKQKIVLERNGGHPNVSQIIPNRFAPRRDPTANRQCSTFLDCRKTWKSIAGTNAFREIPKAPLSRSQKGGIHPAARRCRTGSRRVPAFGGQACWPSWNRQGKFVSKKNQHMQ